jgi:hypothetical protein
MPELEYISIEEARARLLVAYGRAADGEFLEILRRPLANPIAQRNDKGRRKAHPLLIVGAILLVLAGATMTFFSFQS